ncbi:MAG: UDP-N-acetylmuramate dehydrogenase [Acidobacteriota bacterium]
MTAIPPRLQQDVPLAPFTTIGIGGPARFFVRATDEDEVAGALRWARESATPLFILGGGSNLVISDAGFPGLVLRVEIRGISVGENGSDEVSVAAGEEWDPFVAEMIRRHLAGVECLSGIPGFVGGTPIQNVGAYGQEVSETIVNVRAIDVEEGRVRTFTNAECGFGYRDSLFKSVLKGRYLILSVTFGFQRQTKARVRYPDLERELERRGSSNDLQSVRDAVISVRRTKGMVLDSEDPDTRSDGSFFTNPIIPNELVPAFREAALKSGVARDARIPIFPAGEHSSKLSAAWLIEQAGFEKGMRYENVGLSSKHTLAIINRGGGTALQVLELVRMIQDRVRAQFGMELVPEPTFVGF